MLVCEYIMYICTYFCAGTDTHHMIHIEKSVSRTKPNLHLQNKRSYVVQYCIYCIIGIHRPHRQLMNEILLSLLFGWCVYPREMKVICDHHLQRVGKHMIPFGNLTQLLKMAIEIVDLPMNSMVIVHSYVAVYQRLHLPRESIVILLTPLMWIDVIIPTQQFAHRRRRQGAQPFNVIDVACRETSNFAQVLWFMYYSSLLTRMDRSNKKDGRTDLIKLVHGLRQSPS